MPQASSWIPAAQVSTGSSRFGPTEAQAAPVAVSRGGESDEWDKVTIAARRPPPRAFKSAQDAFEPPLPIDQRYRSDMSDSIKTEQLSEYETDSIIGRAKNLYIHLAGGGFADLSRTPSEIVHESRHCIVHHYIPTEAHDPTALPVLLVPPQGPPATCMDLHRGNSLAQFFVDQGRPTYLVDFGDLSTRTDQDLGLDFWIDEVMPKAIRVVSEANDDSAVHLGAWCLGGTFSLFTQAAYPELPIVSVGAVGTPFDFTALGKFEPIRLAGKVTGGKVEEGAIRLIGGVPGKINGLAFKLADPIRLVKKPRFLRKSSGNPEVLAQIQAVDALMDTMEAYPGQSFADIYTGFIRTNDLREGRLRFSDDRVISLTDVTIPVMNVAGKADNIFAPIASCNHLADLVPNAPRVRLEVAPGGHMGVLAGGRAKETTWKYLDEFFKEVEEDLQRGGPVGPDETLVQNIEL